MLPSDITLGEVPNASSQANGVFHGNHGRGGVPDGSRGTRPSNTYKPRSWSWINAEQASTKSPEKVSDEENSFFFRSKSYFPQGITKAILFREMNVEVDLPRT